MKDKSKNASDGNPIEGPSDLSESDNWSQVISYLESRDHETRVLLRQITATLAAVAAENNGHEQLKATQPDSLAWRIMAKIGLVRSSAHKEKADRQINPSNGIVAAHRRHPRVIPHPELSIGKKIVGITVFGLAESDLSKVLDTAVNVCRDQQAYPIFLTDSDCFHLFRELDLTFEYLPPENQRNGPGKNMNWEMYFRRRLDLFMEKWQPDGLMSFGTRSPVPGFRARLDYVAG